MPDVPLLGDFRRALDVCENDPFQEITRYLSVVRRSAVDQVFATLSYFDAVNFAKRANAPAFFSVALQGLTWSTVDGVRGLQPLRRREGDGGLPVQRP